MNIKLKHEACTADCIRPDKARTEHEFFFFMYYVHYLHYVVILKYKNVSSVKTNEKVMKNTKRVFITFKVTTIMSSLVF